MRTLGDVMRMGREGRIPKAGVTLDSAIRGLRMASPSTTKNSRKAACRASIEDFCHAYLAHHFEHPFCELHWDIFSACDKTGSGPCDFRYARIAPRKFGKSTIISLGKVLHALAYQTHHFILMIGESGPASEQNLATLVQELENNDKLLADFPHLAPAKDNKGQYVKWTDRQIIVSSMDTVMAKGMGARMRGLKYRQMRPDLAIIDDPESPETADTFLKRRRHKRWFGGTFMGLGAEHWDIYVIGNLPHHDCLIADLVKSKKWDGKLYRAVNIPKRDKEPYPLGNTQFDGSPLWPEVWGEEELENFKRQPNVGMLGYCREMLNDPRDEEDKIFNPMTFAWIDWTPDMLAKYVAVVFAVDPAGGEKPGDVRRGVRDWCAIVGGGRTRDGFIDIFYVHLTRETPEKQIERLLDGYEKFKARRPRVGIETNMFKNLYAPSIDRIGRKRKLYPGIIEINNQQNKVARITGIQPLIHPVQGSTATVRFARYLYEEQPTYFGQFDEFPTSHDDGPDATEMVIRLLESGRNGGRPVGIGGGSSSYWRSAA